MKVKEYPLTQQEGTIFLENFEVVAFPENGYLKGVLGVQVAKDGRVWVCINGIAFLRFSPHADGKMCKEVPEEYDMGWERYVLTCDGKPGCKRFIVGELATLGNGHFRHPTVGDTDLRNFGWCCYQHRGE